MTDYATCVEEALSVIRDRCPFVPRVAVVLGSGLGGLADSVEDAVVIPYEEIPHWRRSTAPGHKGRLICGLLNAVPVVMMQGRLHGYEGYAPRDTTFPVRVFGEWGVKTLIVTNASGGINYNFEGGDVALISDHINFTGSNPLSGPNNPAWGVRFPDMTEAYSRDLIHLAEKAAENLGQTVRRGVYIGFSGPSYETPAEIRMARAMGADMVGMSTVHEVIVARHMGMKVCGISCIANMAAGVSPHPLTEEEVLEVAGAAGGKITALIAEILRLMGNAD